MTHVFVRLLLGGAALLVVLCLGLAFITARIAHRIKAALQPLGAVVDINGAKIRYIDEGEGPPVVLLHGLAGQMRNFTYALVDRLKTDFRVVVLDRPGCGHSTAAPGAAPDLSTQAATFAAFIRKLDLERPLIVGHSFGGAIALALALDHPQTVGGLALIAPLSQPAENVPPIFRALATRSRLRRWLLSWTIMTPAGVLSGPTTLAQIFGPDTPPDDFDTKGGGLLTLLPRSFRTASAEMVALEHALPALAVRYASIDCPVGILYGTGDRILDPELHGRTLAHAVRGATFDVIEGGHMLPVVAPDKTAAFIRKVAQRLA